VSSREFSAGGVVFRRINKDFNHKSLWLVTKSTPSENFPQTYWRLPKGWLDDSHDKNSPGQLTLGIKKASQEEIEAAAVREVQEEGGVIAKIIKKIGTETFFFTREGSKIMKFVTFFLMEYVSDLPEGYGFETSEIAWLPYQEARGKLKVFVERQILDKAKQILDSGTQENLL
jgi:8-oxo-dGTP pyrophosphatase MutT (NUDIX family)